MRVALTGSAGTGRATIAKRLAAHFECEAITNLSRHMLDAEGFQYGQGIKVETFLACQDRPQRLLELKKQKEAGKEAFITDRSWVDFAAYRIIENNQDPNVSTDIEDAMCMMDNYDAVILVPWNRQPLTVDNVRTINPWYQFMVEAVIKRLLMLYGIEHRHLPILDVNRSVKMCIEYIEGKKKVLQAKRS